MEQKSIITSPGYILKKETLANLASQKPYSEFILEDLDPFPGFYDHYFLPANEKEQKPRSIFILLKELDICNEDKFIRMTMHIRRQHMIEFDAAMAFLQIYNKPTPCVRVFMDDYNQLPELLSHYKQAGLSFLARKEIKPFQSLIEVRKFFELEELQNGIYKDLDQADTYYFRVRSYLKWDDFEKMTITIRNNMDYKLFDAAQAAIYEKSGIIDMIRIYDKRAVTDDLALLSQKYEVEIARMPDS